MKSVSKSEFISVRLWIRSTIVNFVRWGQPRDMTRDECEYEWLICVFIYQMSTGNFIRNLSRRAETGF